MRLRVRLGGAPDASKLRLRLTGGLHEVCFILRRQGGKTILRNRHQPVEVILLENGTQDQCKVSDSWEVRVAWHYGLLRIKAWRQGGMEPVNFLSTHYLGRTWWHPSLVEVDAGRAARVELEVLEFSTEPPPVDGDPTRRGRARELNREAIRLYGLGQNGEATERALEAAQLLREGRGWHQLETATVLNNLAVLLKALGLPGIAEAHLRQALTIKKEVLGEDHPETGAVLHNLGVLLWSTRRATEACHHLRQALAVSMISLGPAHRQTRACLISLGLLLPEKNDLREILQSEGRTDPGADVSVAG